MKTLGNMNWKKKTALLGLMGLSSGISGCMPTANIDAVDIVKGVEALKLKGHIQKDGVPYANRSLTLTTSAYYAKLGINQTFNAGIQTDADGNFETDTSLMLCAARPDYVVFTQKLIEIDSSVRDWMAGAILLPGLAVGGSGSDSHKQIQEFSTTRIPRSICDNFDPTHTDFAMSIHAPSVSYDDMLGERGDRARAEAFKTQRQGILEKDDSQQLREGLKTDITPIQIGVITLSGNEATNGVITDSQLEVTQEAFDGGNIFFVTTPDPKTGQSDPTYSWSVGKMFRMVLKATFDLSNPTDQAPGQIAIEERSSDQRAI